MRKILLLVFITFTFHTYSQDKQDYFANKIIPIEISLEHFLLKKNYIFYGTEYKVLLIVKHDNDFFEFIYINEGDGFKLENINCIKSKFLKKVFDKKCYKEGYIDFESEFYTDLSSYDASGLPTYFSFNLGFQNKYCEYILNIFTNPTPMDREVYNYISLLLLGLE